MFNLARQRDLNTPVEMTLDQGIEKMVKYGRPHMYQHDDKTWSCNVKMRITAASASFDVRSGFGHKTIIEAVGACVNNIHSTLREMGVIK